MAEHLLSPKSAQDFANSPEDFIKLKLSSKLERKLSTKATAQTSSRTPPREDENQITSKRLYTTAQTSRVLSREDEGQKTSRRSRHSDHGHGLNLQSQIGQAPSRSSQVPQSRINLFESLKMILSFLQKLLSKLYRLLGLPIVILLITISCTYCYRCSIPVISIFSNCPDSILQSPSNDNHQSFNTPIVQALQDTAQNFQSVYVEPPDPTVRQIMKEVAIAFDSTGHRTQAWVQESSQTIRQMNFEMDDVVKKFQSIDESIWSSFKSFNNFFCRQLQRELQVKFGNMRESIEELNRTNYVLVDDHIQLNRKLDRLTDELRISQQEWNQKIKTESSKSFLTKDNERIKSLKNDLELTGMIRSFSSSAKNVISCTNIFDDLSVILKLLNKTLRTSKGDGSSQHQQQIKEVQIHLNRFQDLSNQKDACLINALKDMSVNLEIIKTKIMAGQKNDDSDSHSGTQGSNHWMDTMFAADVLPIFVKLGSFVWQANAAGTLDGFKSWVPMKDIAQGVASSMLGVFVRKEEVK